MPEAKTTGQIKRCLSYLGSDAYANYTIMGNLVTFRDKSLYQPNPISVFTNNVAFPRAVATVEDGKFSTEICVSSSDPSTLQKLAFEAVRHAIPMKAAEIQVVLHNTQQREIFLGIGLPIRPVEEVLMMKLEPSQFRPVDGGSVVLPGKATRLGTMYRGIKQDDVILSSARAEPLAFSMHEVCSVWTMPEHRNHGLAKRVVSDLSADILALEDTPVYLVKNSNVASIRLAVSLGYSIKSTLTVYRLPKAEVLLRPPKRGRARLTANG